MAVHRAGEVVGEEEDLAPKPGPRGSGQRYAHPFDLVIEARAAAVGKSSPGGTEAAPWRRACVLGRRSRPGGPSSVRTVPTTRPLGLHSINPFRSIVIRAEWAARGVTEDLAGELGAGEAGRAASRWRIPTLDRADPVGSEYFVDGPTGALVDLRLVCEGSLMTEHSGGSDG
jgi:hypothetical protein